MIRLRRLDSRTNLVHGAQKILARTIRWRGSGLGEPIFDLVGRDAAVAILVKMLPQCGQNFFAFGSGVKDRVHEFVPGHLGSGQCGLNTSPNFSRESTFRHSSYMFVCDTTYRGGV